MEKPIGLMLIIVVISLITELYWLAGIMFVGMILIAIATIEPSRPAPAGGGKKEEVLTPVVMQDVGEPPYLYPPNFEMKLNPADSLMPHYDIASQSLGKLFRIITRTGGEPTYRGRKKVRWRYGPGKGPKGG